MWWNWWKQEKVKPQEDKFSSCVVCGAVYTKFKGNFNIFCPVHRQPHIEQEAKEEEVKKWAVRNLDIIYDMAVDDNRKYYSRLARHKTTSLGSLLNNQQAGCNSQYSDLIRRGLV